MEHLAEWDSFYLIVGSAAGALIGLQFVVMTLIAGRPERPEAEAGSAFATPTIVHFGSALLLAAVLRAPWREMSSVAIMCGAIGLGGIVYSIFVTRRMRSQNMYEPEFEDWLFHCLLPFAAYGMLAGSALGVMAYPRPSMFVVGGSALLLLFIGIHNAWDAITYNVFEPRKGMPESGAGEDDSDVAVPGGDDN